MAWIKEPSFTNTGSTISSIFRKWDNFNLKWDSLSPQEDSSAIGASSSELITFGHHFNDKNIHWEDYSADWNSFLTRLDAPTPSTSFSALGFEDYSWNDTTRHFEDYDVTWNSTFFDNEETLDFYDFRFNGVQFKFNRWNKYFGDKGTLWNNENLSYNQLPEVDEWNGAEFIWNERSLEWDDFYPTGVEAYSVSSLSPFNIDYSSGEWSDITTDWEDYELGWSSLVFNKEDSSISTLTTTSNIVSVWDLNKINNNWEDLDNSWNSMYLGVE